MKRESISSAERAAEQMLPKKAAEKVSKISSATKKRIADLLVQRESGEIYWTNIITELHSSAEYLELFDKLGMGDHWMNSVWLKENGFSAIYFAIKRSVQFKEEGWKGFLKFMGCEGESIMERVEGCKEREDFIRLFKELGLKEEEWQSSEWLHKNGFNGLYGAILKQFKDERWKGFLKFMGCERKPMTELVAGCRTPIDFLTLFDELGVADHWADSAWLKKNGFSALNKALKRNIQFKEVGWEGFLKFMGWGNREPMTVRVRACKKQDSFVKLFAELGIKGEEWQSSRWLINNGFSGLYAAIVIDIRFKEEGWAGFLAFMDTDRILVEEEFEKISSLALEDAIALLGNDDPLKLKRYLQFSYPDLGEEDIDQLVQRSFKGLRDGSTEKSEDRFLAWKEKLAHPTVAEIPETTEENTVTIHGNGVDGSHIFVSGAYTRRKKVNEDGSFEIIVPLKIGERNEIRIMSLDATGETRSMQLDFVIQQEGEADDIAALVELLSNLGVEARRHIQKNPGRFQYLCKCMEETLIKKFARSFIDGSMYVQELLRRETTSASMRKVLKTVLKKFQEIHNAELPGVIDGSLLFFQKYCAYEMRMRMEQNLPGLILANDPGLGKTRTVQAATAQRHTVVITPNSVVSAWAEEAGKVLEDTEQVLALHGLHSNLRKEILRTRASARKALARKRQVQHTYINREFLQKTDDPERFKLLADRQTVAVHDEGHSRANEKSEQSKGAKMLESEFQILVTATPFKNPLTFRRMMAILKPHDPRFTNDNAFLQAFPVDDPEALRTLSIMKDEVMIRFRKEDVMETVDPKQDLRQQRHKLPMKTFVDPEEQGAFTMSMDQAWSLYGMFVDWSKWCRKNNKYIPKDQIAKEDGLRTSNGFAKRHALRQTVNNPRYVNSKASDVKLKQIKEIVRTCLKEGRKIVIFCAYEAQAQKYMKEFANLSPALYTGQTSNKGDMKDSHGNLLLFKKGDTGDSRHGWLLDTDGYPITNIKGEPMSALDYERLTFQSAPDRQLLIATYDAGSVGTTFTAGKAMIFDDLPRDCVEEIQAADRIHRIDPDRLTHADVKYYRLQSEYPKAFLNAVKKRWLVRENGHYKEFHSREKAEKYAEMNDAEAHNAYDLFFEQGTYDEVQSGNLETQRTIFRLINDGIADDSVLKANNTSFKGIENGRI